MLPRPAQSAARAAAKAARKATPSSGATAARGPTTSSAAASPMRSVRGRRPCLPGWRSARPAYPIRSAPPVRRPAPHTVKQEQWYCTPQCKDSLLSLQCGTPQTRLQKHVAFSPAGPRLTGARCLAALRRGTQSRSWRATTSRTTSGPRGSPRRPAAKASRRARPRRPTRPAASAALARPAALRPSPAAASSRCAPSRPVYEGPPSLSILPTCSARGSHARASTPYMSRPSPRRLARVAGQPAVDLVLLVVPPRGGPRHRRRRRRRRLGRLRRRDRHERHRRRGAQHHLRGAYARRRRRGARLPAVRFFAHRPAPAAQRHVRARHVTAADAAGAAEPDHG